MMAPHTPLAAFFLEDSSSRNFCLLHQPETETEIRGALLYLHPFAEELNKSRRMASLQASALARAGWWVLQVDLHGCGDSAGDFADATWERWVSDARLAANWLHDRSGVAPGLWGLRSGCLLAAAVASGLEWAPDLIFWQPVTSGRQHLQQFLRVKLAGDMLNIARSSGGSTGQFREQLRSGAAIEIGGYMLSPELALGLDAATLEPPMRQGRLLWFELSGATTAELSPAGRLGVEAWRAAGWNLSVAAMTGVAFWQSQEIEEIPELIEATTRLLGGPA